MQKRPSKHLLTGAMAAGLLVLAACGSSSSKSTSSTAAATTTAPTATTTASTSAATTAASTASTTGSSTAPTTGSSTAPTTGSSTASTTGSSTTGTGGGKATAGELKDICPAEIKIQTDWVPEAEHGFLYQMIGKGYTVNNNDASVTGPLTASGGVDTGVKLTILSGGSAKGFSSDTTLMYADPTILLGFVYTDEAIQNSAKFPTVAIESGYNKNPQMIMWDPATYPNVTGIADLGKAKVKVRYFGGAAYMDFLTSTGVLSKDQVDGSYKGDPSLFVADEGKSAQQGFGSAEPYQYEKIVKNWLKPVKFQYINDVGWKNYAESIATLPANITKYSACFKKLVPIIQQSTIDYTKSPAAANTVILAAVAGFGNNFGWTYDQGAADYAATTIAKDKLVDNGPDGVLGKFDITRVTDLITKAIPVYTAQDSPPKAGLKASDIVTNEFLDPSIGL